MGAAAGLTSGLGCRRLESRGGGGGVRGPVSLEDEAKAEATEFAPVIRVCKVVSGWTCCFNYMDPLNTAQRVQSATLN